MFTRAIVRPPSANFASGLTSVDLGQPNYELALEQHEAYCRALEDCGLSLIRMEADDRYPDSTFVEDTAVVTARGFVMTQPGAPSRLGEIEGVDEVLHNFFRFYYAIHGEGRLDGGDVCEAGDHFFIGVSRRTNEEGAAQLAEFLDTMGYGSTLIDIRSLGNILHLKSGLAFLGGKRLGGVESSEDAFSRDRGRLACTEREARKTSVAGETPAVPGKSIRKTEHDYRLAVIDELKDLKPFSGYDLIRVNAAEAYAANCLWVNGRVLLAKGYPDFQRQLQELGYETVTLEISEFQKMDGGLSCLSLRF
ncbi:MAG TPA: arginine deiminase family protein [Pyrinomonadaceae bacterium]